MGEATAAKRREIEQTRNDLTQTIGKLRVQGRALKHRAVKVGATGGGAVMLTAIAVGGAVLVLHRRGGAITKAAKRLPRVARGAAVPAARGADRWFGRGSKRVGQQREELVNALSDRVAANHAKAERQANPLWRRTAVKALETMATVGVATLIRRAMGDAVGTTGGKSLHPQPEREMLGKHLERSPTEESTPAATASRGASTK
jgi:hypothetical protein